jgi:hypothetical protein
MTAFGSIISLPGASLERQSILREQTESLQRRERRMCALCHEYRRSKRRCVTVPEMKEGPSDSAIRSLIPNHRKLLRSKAVVVNVAEKLGR